MRKLLFALPIGLGILLAQVDDVAAFRIRAHVRLLASDLLEGRAVGARGGDIATEYLASQFALSGLQPAGDNGTYFQKVPLVGVKTSDTQSLTASKGDDTVTLHWSEDFVGVNQRQTPSETLDAELVFVGHGIHAPEFKWDDYAGADVHGKVVVLFTNEPPSSDPRFFGGKALTYYGRWSYKFEEAARRGALGCLIIHTPQTAGYGWEVVRNSWSREDAELPRVPQANALAFAGWLTEAAGEKLLALGGQHVAPLLAAADSHATIALPLGITLRGNVVSQIRQIQTRNVVARVTGADPQKKDEAVLYSAHWDHLGISTPVNGDNIYNGAVDNATGCAVLLETARAWAALGHKPRRSALFISMTAEENGLLGSAHYSLHPIVPLAKTAVMLNYDTLQPFGRVQDIRVMGGDRTTLWPEIQALAQRMDLQLKPDPRPEQGSFYRSDQFSLARAGVPALGLKIGEQFYGKPPGYGPKLFQEYNTERYHQPSDEFRDTMDFSGLEQIARFGLLLGLDAANMDELPRWKPGDEFARK